MSATDAEAETLYDKLGRGAQADVKTIAAALLAAEKRGEERERRDCGERYLTYCDLQAEDNRALEIYHITGGLKAIRAGN